MKFSCLLRAGALGLLLGAGGCTRPEEAPRPAVLLPKEQMVSLLLRLHLLEARTETSRLAPDSARSLFLIQQRNLFWQYHVSAPDSTFERSYRYYAVHGKDLDEIYGAVVDSLQAMQRKQGGPVGVPHH